MKKKGLKTLTHKKLSVIKKLIKILFVRFFLVFQQIRRKMVCMCVHKKGEKPLNIVSIKDRKMAYSLQLHSVWERIILTKKHSEENG